jgi:hypothetical protein
MSIGMHTKKDISLPAERISASQKDSALHRLMWSSRIQYLNVVRHNLNVSHQCLDHNSQHLVCLVQYLYTGCVYSVPLYRSSFPWLNRFYNCTYQSSAVNVIAHCRCIITFYIRHERNIGYNYKNVLFDVRSHNLGNFRSLLLQLLWSWSNSRQTLNNRPCAEAGYNKPAVVLRVEATERKPGFWGYNCATFSLGGQ